MSDKTGLYMDSTDFDKGFKRIVEKTIPETLAEGLYRVVAPLLLRYAIKEVPTVPKKTGHLRRSQKALKPLLERGEITLVVGFNTEYAARLHEALDNWDWSEPGSGPKYLETKLINHSKEFLEKLADYVSRKAK